MAPSPKTANGRNLDQELFHARLIQDMLLPTAIPALTSVRMCFEYVPFHDLSGDFLDYYYKKSTNELGFIICDVSGHGIPSALIAAMMKMALQLWGEYLDDPVGTLEKIRKMFLGKLGLYHVSVILGYLDLNTGLMKCVNAGHPPMLHLRKDGEFTEIKPEGCIIHEDIQCRLEEYAMQLEPEDRLVLFTDGLVEARNHKAEDLGLEGLKRLLQKYGKLPIDEVCKAVIRDAMALAADGDSIHDDLSLFVIEFVGDSGSKDKAG